MRRGQIEIRDWSEVGVETHRANLFPEDAPMLLEELCVFGLGDLCGCRRRSDYVAQTIDRATFHIYTREDGRADYALTVRQQLEGLLRGRDVAGEENDPGG